MRIKETWKHVLFLTVMGLILFVGYPVVAGMTQSSLGQKETLDNSFADTYTLLAAVKGIEAHVQEVQVRVKWDTIRFHDQQQAELFLQTIAKTANITVWKEEVRNGIHIYRGEAKDRTGIEQEIYVHLRPVEHTDEIAGGLGVTFRGKEEQVALMKGITVNYARISGNTSELPQIISCVRGIYNGKLENDLQKKKANQLLASLEGKMVESLEEETVLSYSAYSPLFHTVIATNHRSMNLQVAAHYDTYMQGTVITAGLPIITAEY